MNMDWTSEKKGDAMKKDDKKNDEDYFKKQKEKILKQIEERMQRDRSHLCCSITGAAKVGKTGLAMDCRTKEEIAKGMKVLVIDFDDGAEPTWKTNWNDPNIIVYCPTEKFVDGTVDWETTFNNGKDFCRLCKEYIAEGNVKAVILDGVDKCLEGSSDVLREHLVKQQQREGSIVLATDSVRVSTLDWRIRNRVYNRQLDLVCDMKCDRFFITHMKPIYDNISVPTPIGEVPDWHKTTPAKFIQMIHISKKQTRDKKTNYVARLEASKTNPSLVGKEWVIFTTNGESEWFGIPELREGTL